MIPEGKRVAYECTNGHVNERHTSKRVPPMDGGTTTPGLMPACLDCGADLERVLVPLRECQECGNVWAYTGDADRPTCTACRSKRTAFVGD